MRHNGALLINNQLPFSRWTAHQYFFPSPRRRGVGTRILGAWLRIFYVYKPFLPYNESLPVPLIYYYINLVGLSLRVPRNLRVSPYIRLDEGSLRLWWSRENFPLKQDNSNHSYSSPYEVRSRSTKYEVAPLRTSYFVRTAGSNKYFYIFIVKG